MLSALIILAIIYVLVGIFAYFGADSIIFQPQPMFYGDNDWAFHLQTPSGEKISAKFFKNEKAEFTILHSHGNAEDIFTSTPFFEDLSKAGFNVLAYDYRGYGTSEGTPSEQNSYEDIETAYNYLVNELKTPPERIILHGRSLGGAISIDLASRRKCGGIIVESSFISAFRVITKISIYPFDKFTSLDKINQVQSPVLFIHGTTDSLIPLWHSEKLFEAANEPKSFFSVENAGHNDVFATAGEKYLNEIVGFANRLKNQP
jgi:fermentation-respiration switch protein FrsA (DUF1100 family)